MNIESNITVHCGNLSARDLIPVQSLASEMGADVRPFAGPHPDHVRAELNTVIRETAGGISSVIVSNHDIRRHDLSGVNLKDYTRYIRERLAGQLGDFIRKEVLESITPPPLYNDTGVRFMDQPIFLKSTGERQRDKSLAERFSRFARDLNSDLI